MHACAHAPDIASGVQLGAAALVALSRAVSAELSIARSELSCTTLADGTVLVTGGELLDGDRKIASNLAEVFQP